MTKKDESTGIAVALRILAQELKEFGEEPTLLSSWLRKGDEKRIRQEIVGYSDCIKTLADRLDLLKEDHTDLPV